MSREKGTILAGGVTQTEVYNVTKNKDDVREELKKAIQTLADNDVDLIICEVSLPCRQLMTSLMFAYF